MSAGAGGRGRSGVDQSAGGEERERKQDVQRDERGHAGAAAAQRQQEGGETLKNHNFYHQRNEERKNCALVFKGFFHFQLRELYFTSTPLQFIVIS